MSKASKSSAIECCDEGANMEGRMRVIYTVMCENDVDERVSLQVLLANEKVLRAIKSEFAKGIRNIELTAAQEAEISIKTHKEPYELIVEKDDFADILVLAEEDARAQKRLKKECEGIELIDIVTLD
jgi:hypothetical protein